MVESALITTLVFALIVLTFDFAFAIFLKATFEHAAREGARYAITYSTLAGFGQDASIKQTVVNSSFGFLRPENVAVNYYNPKSPGDAMLSPYTRWHYFPWLLAAVVFGVAWVIATGKLF